MHFPDFGDLMRPISPRHPVALLFFRLSLASIINRPLQVKPTFLIRVFIYLWTILTKDLWAKHERLLISMKIKPETWIGAYPFIAIHSENIILLLYCRLGIYARVYFDKYKIPTPKVQKIISNSSAIRDGTDTFQTQKPVYGRFNCLSSKMNFIYFTGDWWFFYVIGCARDNSIFAWNKSDANSQPIKRSNQQAFLQFECVLIPENAIKLQILLELRLMFIFD